MMKKHLRCLALMGQIPPNPKHIKKSYTPRTVEQKLAREGWVRVGGGFSDPLLENGVYVSYSLDEFCDVSRSAAIPHYKSFSSTPDCWMYGPMIKRKYVYYYFQEDRLEDRGASFHRTDNTRTFKRHDLKWIDYESYPQSWD